MTTDETRQLAWDGCFNVRDLGGLETTDGGRTQPGKIVRADALSTLTERGWAELVAYGVRTVIDLRNDDERGEDVATRPSSVQTIHIPLDQTDDREFWDDWENGPQFATPLYYEPHLRRFPSTSAAVLAAIAQAPPGGVAVHCAGGRDRTGQISILALSLAGVALDEIVADYLLSYERLPALYAARGEEDQTPVLKAFLSDRGTSVGAEIERFLQADVHGLLAEGGLEEADVAAFRKRLLT